MITNELGRSLWKKMSDSERSGRRREMENRPRDFLPASFPFSVPDYGGFPREFVFFSFFWESFSRFQSGFVKLDEIIFRSHTKKNTKFHLNQLECFKAQYMSLLHHGFDVKPYPIGLGSSLPSFPSSVGVGGGRFLWSAIIVARVVMSYFYRRPPVWNHWRDSGIHFVISVPSLVLMLSFVFYLFIYFGRWCSKESERTTRLRLAGACEDPEFRLFLGNACRVRSHT